MMFLRMGENILCRRKDKKCFENKSVVVLIRIATLLFSTKTLIYQYILTRYSNIYYVFVFSGIKEMYCYKGFHCRSPPPPNYFENQKTIWRTKYEKL